MKRKLLKLSILLIAFYVVFSVFCYSNAESLFEKMENQASGFIEKGKTTSENIDMGESFKEVAGIGSILTGIGTAVMLGVTAYMGIKYLTAGPDAKAKLKTQLIGVVVSGVVIFGSFYIWQIVIDIASKF